MGAMKDLLIRFTEDPDLSNFTGEEQAILRPLLSATEDCGECGAAIPASASDMVNRYHEGWCSLSSDDSDGNDVPAREQDPVTVVFRKWKDRKPGDLGDGVIVLFPYVPWTRDGALVASYEHHGQHGGANYDGVIEQTRAATPEEYAALRRELEAPPFSYRLIVRVRVNRRTGNAPVG